MDRKGKLADKDGGVVPGTVWQIVRHVENV